MYLLLLVPRGHAHSNAFSVRRFGPSTLITLNAYSPRVFVLPAAVRIQENGDDLLFYCHVSYVDSVDEMTKDAFQLTMTDETHGSSCIAFGEIGKYKNKRWAFQDESRFRLVIFPFNPIYCNPDDVSSIAVNTIRSGVPVPISEYFLKLRSRISLLAQMF